MAYTYHTLPIYNIEHLRIRALIHMSSILCIGNITFQLKTDFSERAPGHDSRADVKIPRVCSSNT